MENKKGNYIQRPGEEDKILSFETKNLDILDQIPPGIYTPGLEKSMFSSTMVFEKAKIVDNLINFSEGIVSECIDKIKSFFSEKTLKAYQEMKIGHKLGMLLYGPAGTGKTSTAYLIMKTLVLKNNAICLDCTGVKLDFIINVIEQIRRHQDNPIICFVDEFDNSIRYEEEEFLSFLDGSDSVTNFVFIGCTNKLHKIPSRIKERPSRIKYCIEIKSFPIKVYEEFIKSKIPNLTPSLVSEFSFKAEEKCLTLDQLKHCLIDYKIDGIPFNDSIRSVKRTVDVDI